MDYSIFKPGDKVRSVRTSGPHAVGIVLCCNEKCLLIQPEDREVPAYYTTWEFEKVPERTSKFTNVFGHWNGGLLISRHTQPTKAEALSNRLNTLLYIGIFEQVFEDGKLVETKYHPDD